MALEDGRWRDGNPDGYTDPATTELCAGLFMNSNNENDKMDDGDCSEAMWMPVCEVPLDKTEAEMLVLQR